MKKHKHRLGRPPAEDPRKYRVVLLLTEDEYNELSWQAEALSHRKKIPVSEAAAARELVTQAPAQLDELRHAVEHAVDCTKTKLCADCRRLLTSVQDK